MRLKYKYLYPSKSTKKQFLILRCKFRLYIPWLENRCYRRQRLGCWHSWPPLRAEQYYQRYFFKNHFIKVSSIICNQFLQLASVMVQTAFPIIWIITFTNINPPEQGLGVCTWFKNYKTKQLTNKRLRKQYFFAKTL